jgi:hypothetical protein
MYRMMKTLPCLGAASALALTLACNAAPNSPTAPDASIPGAADAAADGSTLKVGTPTLVSPTGDVRLSTRQPLMIATSTSGKFVNRPFSYEFQLLDDNNNVVRSATVGGGDTPSWQYPENLERDTPYRWKVRATFNGSVGPWSSTGRFFTVRENRTPNPTSGRLPLPGYGAGVVRQVAAERPDLLNRSCQEHGGTWEFLDLVVDTLRLQDTRWGYNWKRGNVGDPSLDVVAYNYGSQPDENTINVYIIDVIGGHCGPNPNPVFNDVTQITADGGSIGRWASRGRFAGSQGVQ